MHVDPQLLTAVGGLGGLVTAVWNIVSAKRKPEDDAEELTAMGLVERLADRLFVEMKDATTRAQRAEDRADAMTAELLTMKAEHASRAAVMDRIARELLPEADEKGL